MNETPNNDFSDLRKKAEEKLRRLPKILKRMTPEDILDIMHELHVYQIELEMQNEELIEAQQRIEQSYEKYSDLFDLAPIAYFIFDRDGLILNVNYTGSNLLCIDKKQLVGKPLSVFLTGKQSQDDFFHHRNLVFETERSQSCEVQMRKSNSSVFYAMMESMVLKDEDGRFTHFRSAILDVTRRKEQETAIALALKTERELSELKSRFISMASHEFRTPLATVLSSLYLLEKYNQPNDEEKRTRHLKKIRNSVQGLNDILNDFLSLGQIENGNIKNSPARLDVAQFLKETFEEIKTSNGIHTFSYQHTGAARDVILDKKLLKICVSNLLTNAVKYSPDGGTIELRSEITLNPKTLIISVKDEGIGIPEDDQSKVFGQFFRARNAETIQGTGLGLNIVKKLVNIIGGSISFMSREGNGTTFILKITKC